MTSFSEILVRDPSSWAGYIADIGVDGNRVEVALQVDRKEDEALGDRAARSLSTLLSSESTQGLDWVVVTDGVGTVIAQEQLSPVS